MANKNRSICGPFAKDSKQAWGICCLKSDPLSALNGLVWCVPPPPVPNGANLFFLVSSVGKSPSLLHLLKAATNHLININQSRWASREGVSRRRSTVVNLMNDLMESKIEHYRPNDLPEGSLLHWPSRVVRCYDTFMTSAFFF